MTARTLVANVRDRVVMRTMVALQLRPRLSAVLTVGLVLLVAWATPVPQAQADDDDDCGGGILGVICKGAHMTPAYKGAKTAAGVASTAEKAKKAIDAVDPQNFLGEWAKGLVSASTYLLTFIQSAAEKITTPAYDQPWWIRQYEVSFGLALLVLPFLLILVTAKLGGSDGAVSGVELLRQSGWRLVFVVPLIAAAPALLYSVQQLAVKLMSAFATQSVLEGHGAIGGMLRLFEKKAGHWGDFGGTVIVILMCFFIVITAVVLLLELTVSQWGLLLTGLLVPLVLVAWVYPPWSSALKKLASVIGGLMFMPAVVFFFFNTVWSALNSAVNGNHAQNSGFMQLLFIMVSLIMLDAFPVVAWWLLSLVTPDAGGMDADVRGIAPTPTGGDVMGPERGGKSVGEPSGGEDAGGGSGGGAGSGGEDEAADDSDGGTGSGGGGDKGPDGGGEDSDGSPADSGGIGGGADSEGAAMGEGSEAAAAEGGGGEAAAAGGGVGVAAVAAKETAEKPHDDTQASAGRTMNEGGGE
ncbi:hypothetical protein ACFTZI_32590 [Streptomyces decoyicus]|uniref:hypothetical protein n=1 Tax=Streptomyces decoyicus TaxID=249567 RepID=UPI0036282599